MRYTGAWIHSWATCCLLLNDRIQFLCVLSEAHRSEVSQRFPAKRHITPWFFLLLLQHSFLSSLVMVGLLIRFLLVCELDKLWETYLLAAFIYGEQRHCPLLFLLIITALFLQLLKLFWIDQTLQNRFVQWEFSLVYLLWLKEFCLILRMLLI